MYGPCIHDQLTQVCINCLQNQNVNQNHSKDTIDTIYLLPHRLFGSDLAAFRNHRPLFVCALCVSVSLCLCVCLCVLDACVCMCFLPFSLFRSAVLSVFAHIRILCRILDKFPFVASATIRFSHLEQSVNDHYFYQFICMLRRVYILRLPVCSLLSVCRWWFSFDLSLYSLILSICLVQYQYEHADTHRRCCSFLLGRSYSTHHTKNCDLCKQTEKYEEKH